MTFPVPTNLIQSTPLGFNGNIHEPAWQFGTAFSAVQRLPILGATFEASCSLPEKSQLCCASADFAFSRLPHIQPAYLIQE